MAKELSQKQLEELVVGKPAPPRVVFFDQPRLDHAASKAAGRRVYVNSVMIKRTNPGMTDWVAEFAQDRDYLEHPEEYERYLRSRKGTTSPPITIIPNAEPIHIQELIDCGLGSIGALCEAEVIPDHLKYVQDGAKVISQALKEASNGRQEENQQEESKQEVEGHGTGVKAEDVSAQGGREQRDHERRPEPTGVSRPQSEGRAEGDAPGGQLHGDSRGNAGQVGYNWNMTIEV